MTDAQMIRPGRGVMVGLVEVATRAPSSHNTQPWRFRLGDGEISVVTHLDLGTRTADTDRGLALDAPLLAVLGTEHDERLDWIRAGEALEHLLLRAAAEGLHAGYLNQPCQVASLRPQLAELIDRAGVPQLVLRLGRPTKSSTPSPRRPVGDVIDTEPPARLARETT